MQRGSIFTFSVIAQFSLNSKEIGSDRTQYYLKHYFPNTVQHASYKYIKISTNIKLLSIDCESQMLLPSPLQTSVSARNPTTFHGPADDSRPLPLWDICWAGPKLTVGDRNSTSLGRYAHLMGLNMRSLLSLLIPSWPHCFHAAFCVSNDLAVISC